MHTPPHRLRFGVSGLPIGDGRRKHTYATGIRYLADIGLDAMELPFVRSVNVSPRNAPDILAAKALSGVHLTAHGSYYVNLNARESELREKSRQRLVEAAEGARLVDAACVVFHPGYYLGADSAAALEAISSELGLLAPAAADTGARFCLETTGKPTQFGTLDEIVELCRRHPHCRPCIDFAHVHARGNGCLTSYGHFAAILDQVQRGLGRAALEDLHMHVAGIAYSARGERRHLPLLESDFPFAELLKALKDFRVCGCLIAEGPLVEGDALLLKETYLAL